jgi:hypothetical protein
MKLFVYEGTPSEIAEVAHLIGASSRNQGERATSNETNGATSEDNEELSVEQVKRVFQRRPLLEPMKVFLRELYKAGEERIKSDDLKAALGYGNAEFRGMLGAFGRRLKNTEGLPEGVRLLDEAWDHDLRQKTWALPPNVRKALENLKLV